MGQSDSSLGSSSGQYFSSVAGSHSLAEAVLLGSVSLFGLIGSEHLKPPSLCHGINTEKPPAGRRGGLPLFTPSG